MNHLSVRHISKSFANTPVLKDVVLDIKKGSFTTLLGPSGCGKTTLLRIIAGLEQPDEGEIYAHDKVFVDVKAGIFASPQARNLGFVFQDYGLWPHMTVIENVSFPLKMAKWSKAKRSERANEVLTAVHLCDQANRLPHELSGGQKQRVSIARALAGKPDLILFDEPLSNLDANLRESLGRDIRLLTKSLGLTCVNVTHDRREAQLLSDSIALMQNGVIHQLGKPEDLFCTPTDPWAAQFLDAGNVLPAGKVIGVDETLVAHVLVPRGAFRINESAQGMVANVLHSTFIEDRYEITADLDGHVIKMFSDRPENPGKDIFLSVDSQDLQAYPHG